MRFLGLLILLMAAAVSLDASPASACDCSGIGDGAAFALADAVFVGTVESMPSFPAPEPRSSADPGVWRFSVE